VLKGHSPVATEISEDRTDPGNAPLYTHKLLECASFNGRSASGGYYAINAPRLVW
jgi:hypothetical protein